MSRRTARRAASTIAAIAMFWAIPAKASAGTFTVGAGGGWAEGVAASAVENFDRTEFEGAMSGYALAGWDFGGLVLGLEGHRTTFELWEDDADLGDLRMSPVLLFVGGQSRVRRGHGWGGHFRGGAGVNFTSFSKGPALRQIERNTGNQVEIVVRTEDSFIMGFAGGADYFFSPHVALVIDARLFLGNVGTEWEVRGSGGSAEVEDLDNFYASNVQLGLGLHFWIGKDRAGGSKRSFGGKRR